MSNSLRKLTLHASREILLEDNSIAPEPHKKMASAQFFDKQPGEYTGRLLLTILEAAKTLGMSEKAVRMHIERKNIPFVRVGRRIFFSRKILEEWIESQVVHSRIGAIPLSRR